MLINLIHHSDTEERLEIIQEISNLLKTHPEKLINQFYQEGGWEKLKKEFSHMSPWLLINFIGNDDELKTIVYLLAFVASNYQLLDHFCLVAHDIVRSADYSKKFQTAFEDCLIN